MTGGGHPNKHDDFAPYPVKEQFPGIDYCLCSPPPWHEAVFLGFQHYVVMLGTTVLIASILVPQMGGGHEEKAKVIQTILFAAGINTLLQSLFGTRLPAVIGGSYAFVIPAISIILSPRFSYIDDPYERFIETMRAIQGALIVASIFQIVIGFSGLWSIVMRFCCPLSAVPLVTLVGLGLYTLAFPRVAKCIEVGLPMLILLLILTQYVAHVYGGRKVLLIRFAVIFSILIIWLYAHILTVSGAYRDRPPLTQFHCRTDRSGLLYAAPWVSIPYPFQWGRPTFHAGDVFAMLAASFVSVIESTGTYLATSRYAGCTHPPCHILTRGIGWQGVSLLLDGMLGTANGSTASVENAGLLALTRVGSRRVIQIAAGFMIFFGILGKFGAFFASIPMPIFAALYCILFIYVAASGVNYLQYCCLNSFRTMFILGFSIFMGLSVPQYFNEYTLTAGYGPAHTPAIWFNDIINVIFSSPATVGFIVAILLNCTWHHHDPTIRRERGWHWWEKFRSYGDDPRSEEFYSLPWKLNTYFPSV